MGFENPTFRMRGERSNWLRHRGGSCTNMYDINIIQFVKVWGTSLVIVMIETFWYIIV